MKTRLLFLLLFIGLGLVSCDNNDERFFLYEIDDIYFPDQPISDIVMEITDGAAVGMTGGVAPYTVETGDEEIAKAKIQEEYGYVMIAPVQLGTTFLVVKDANGLTAKIDIKIIKGTKSFTTKKVSVKVEGLEGDEKVDLENQVIASSDMHVTGGIKFIYDTKDSGTLTVIPSKDDISNVITASFTREIRQTDEKTFTSFIYVNYNDIDHVLYFTSPEKTPSEDDVTRALGPLYCWLVEDVTKIYNKTYPNVTSVKRIYEGQSSRY